MVARREGGHAGPPLRNTSLRIWMPAIHAGMTKSPVGEHKIMNHFVVQGLFLFRLRLCHVCLCGEYPASLTLTCRIRLCKKGAVVIPLLRS